MAPQSELLYPLYNTTFSVHRVSPLYTSHTLPLNNTNLHDYARRFRDILAGDVLRGVRVGLALEDDVLSRVGTLQAVTWRLLREEEAWNPDEELGLEPEDTTMSMGTSRGMIVRVVYEKIGYTVVLLRDVQGRSEEITLDIQEEGIERFPLLLAKMPVSLKETFMDFLATTFDTRISSLRLPRGYITSAFEKYISDISIGDDGEPFEFVERSALWKKIVKDTEVFIGFDLPGGSTALKTVDIHIDREDLPRMVLTGKSIENGANENSPFQRALTTYVQAHLALDLMHENVKVVRIACGAFVLGDDGRIKVFKPVDGNDEDNPQGRATRRLFNDLISTAAGGSLIAGEDGR